jgi:hypothetical protein
MILFLPAAHFTSGRGGSQIDHIVIHWMATTLAGCDATFTRGAREASAHYGIEGKVVHQYVRDTDTAWHAANGVENRRSIGIEHSAQPGRDASPETIATSVALIVSLCRKYRIKPANIYPHNRFTATQCPGTIPIAAMIAAVRAQLNGTPLPEDDLPLTDTDLDKIVTRILGANLGRSGPTVGVALQRAAVGSVALDPAEIAAAVFAKLPAGGTGATLADIAKATNDDLAARLLA